jgi:hypothetical protein
MRPWMTVLASAIGALVATAVVVRPELATAPPSQIVPDLARGLPTLAVSFLAVYALCALVLTTGALIAGILHLRRLADASSHSDVAHRDWLAARDSAGLGSLMRWLRTAPGQAARADDSLLTQKPFDRTTARREIARLLYIGLARTQFFGALIVLAAIAAFGLAQEHLAAPFLAAIPTIPLILIVVGLILLGCLARLAVDVAAEPMVEAFARAPAEHVEVILLRRALEVFEAVRASLSPAAESALAIPDRVVPVLEESQRALLDAVGRMAATTEALGATTRSSLEAIEKTLRAPLARAASAGEASAPAVGFVELQSAVEALTSVLERVAVASQAGETTPVSIGAASQPKAGEPRLARELSKLLQEMEAGS